MQGLQRIRIGCQIIKEVSESGAGGLVAAEDENEGLGKDLVFSQAYNKISYQTCQQLENYFHRLRPFEGCDIHKYKWWLVIFYKAS